MDDYPIFFKQAKNGIHVCICGHYCDSLDDVIHHLGNTYIEGYCEGGVRRKMLHDDRLKDEYECACGKIADWYDILIHHEAFKTSCVTEHLRKKDSYCDVCNLQCVSVIDYKKHCNTIKHTNRISGVVYLPLECKTCCLTFTSQPQVRNHLGSQRHKKLVESGEIAKPKELPTFCNICNVRCPSQSQMRTHLETKKHKKLASIDDIRQRIHTQ
jgi:hypothetical protein